MNRTQSRSALLLLSVFAMTLFACGDPVPLKEMTGAKSAITRAEEVKASKYAPEAFENAKQLLFSCHDSIKLGKYEDAGKIAVESRKKAEEAYNIALPLLTKDTIDEADSAVLSADEVYSMELANADFDHALNLQKAAHDEFEAKDFLKSYKSALECISAAEAAKSLSLEKKDTLKDEIAQVNETIERAKALDGETTSADKLAVAKENLDLAQKGYDSLKLKEGFAALEVAKLNADEAYFASVMAFASARIAKAEVAVADARKSTNVTFAEDDLAGSEEMLSTAKSQFDSNQYEASIQSADEAMRLSGIVLAALPPKSETTDTDTTADTTAVAAEEPENTDFDIYIVKYYKNRARDCLWFIAKRFYNNPREWKKIYNANRDQIKNPDFIRPGWKLRVPKKVKPAPVIIEQPIEPVIEDGSPEAPTDMPSESSGEEIISQ